MHHVNNVFEDIFVVFSQDTLFNLNLTIHLQVG